MYVSNESNVDVFFDNLQVIHKPGPILEETHYPFGLTMAGISSKALNSGQPENKKWKFQNQEFDEDLGINWYQFKYRSHDPQIGRFIELDPLANEYRFNSPYAFSENRVINGVELDGLEHANYSYNAKGMEEITRATARESRTDADKRNDASAKIDMIPGIGDAKGFIETFTGKDMVTGEKLSLFNRALGLFFLSELRSVGKLGKAIDKGADALRMGRWVDAGESMSDAAASYQKQITGIDASKSFKIDGVKFDGVTMQGVLMDAKSGMENFVGKDGAFLSWFDGAKDMINQANRQLKVAKGAPIKWYFEKKNQ